MTVRRFLRCDEVSKRQAQDAADYDGRYHSGDLDSDQSICRVYISLLDEDPQEQTQDCNLSKAHSKVEEEAERKEQPRICFQLLLVCHANIHEMFTGASIFDHSFSTH